MEDKENASESLAVAGDTNIVIQEEVRLQKIICCLLPAMPRLQLAPASLFDQAAIMFSPVVINEA